jgi:hypothetical protein
MLTFMCFLSYYITDVMLMLMMLNGLAEWQRDELEEETQELHE